MANPTLLTSPIAENGDKNVIPASTGATTGLLDQEHGFQQINELPLQAGGLPPQRKDFNGAFNLLSKILFYAQKGYVFEYDENQDYFAGCIVKDTDGGLYCANNDVSASSTHPKDDATNWVAVYRGINQRDVVTTSGTYTAPVSGWYKVTVKGAGGGGGGSHYVGGLSFGGAGGGEGGTTIRYLQMKAGDTATIVIGAGGTQGASDDVGGNGGDTTFTYNGTTYTAGGGQGGDDSGSGGNGGSGDILGCAGGASVPFYGYGIQIDGASGGGAGGGGKNIFMGMYGGGGRGGEHIAGDQTGYHGYPGGDGYVWVEYFA
jgi:hypothetical protein